MPEAATADHQHQRGGTPHPAADVPDDAIRRPQPRSREDAEPREGKELIDAAARSDKNRSEKLDPEEQADALEWFLSDEAESLTDEIELNVGTRRKPKWIKWEVQAVDRDELRRIRRQSQQGNRRRQITGQADIDGDQANVQIVIRGTVYPDLRAAARQIGLVDPADGLKRKFARKPGLIDQIAGEIMSLSGYDDEDVREVDAARG